MASQGENQGTTGATVEQFRQKTAEKIHNLGLDGLISSFIRKYGISTTTREMPGGPACLLQDLLASKGVRPLTYQLLEAIIRKECEQVETADFRENILKHVPVSLDDYVRAAMVELGQDAALEANIGHLSALLTDRQVPHSVGELRDTLLREEKRRSLERFEHRLLSTVPTPNPQVMDGEEFEQFLVELFTRMGYTVEVTARSGDQGADMVLTRSGIRTVVQAKRYSNPVGNEAVQQVVGAVRYYSADRSIVVTTSTFTPSACKLAAANSVHLIDGAVLEGLVEQYWGSERTVS